MKYDDVFKLIIAIGQSNLVPQLWPLQPLLLYRVSGATMLFPTWLSRLEYVYQHIEVLYTHHVLGV
jgi:hypothetical protein